MLLFSFSFNLNDFGWMNSDSWDLISIRVALVSARKKKWSEKIPDFFGKRNFVIFQERDTQNADIFRTRSIFRTLITCKMERFTKNSYLVHFLAQARKKNPPQEDFLYFRKRKPPKNSLCFRKRNFLILHETFYIPGSSFPRSKRFYTFSYKETKFSKLKYFSIIIIKRFFSFYNIFFYTQQAFVVHEHIVFFFLFLL